MKTIEPIFFNRDISWLGFNERVLEEALRKDLPVLERLKFLTIVSSNFDEFFMIRVAAIKQAAERGLSQDPSGLNPEKQLEEISIKVRSILERQHHCLNYEIFPALAESGLELVRPESYNVFQRKYLATLFHQEIFPTLTPLRFEFDEKLPSIGNLKIYIAFLLQKENIDNADEFVSVIQVPSSMDRLVWFPAEQDGKVRWTFLDDVIHTFGDTLFPGYIVQEKMIFKITRDADFSVDEKRDEDFIEAMEEVLVDREHSQVVRMVFNAKENQLIEKLSSQMNLSQDDLYEVQGPLDLRTLSELVNVRGFDELKETPRKNFLPLDIINDEPLWNRINQADLMLHFPYHSFDPVIRFFHAAAADPDVVSIKATLYRTSGDSPIVKSLERAALNGKQVTVVVELKARFDEERNISWANRLERAGVIVVYGLARLKVHAKAALIVRRESGGIKRYVHLSTGNYNDKTAKLYGDICLFTANQNIASDISLFFNMITGYSVINNTKHLIVAPMALKAKIISLIDRETLRAEKEKPGTIMAKMNSLGDTDVIKALYRASQAGVKIQLNVRGICMLVPGISGLSENIEVVSIVDRYLEHSRIFYFPNGGAGEYYLSSADWMTRNLERRVELMFPVLHEDTKKQISYILESYFKDNSQTRILQKDGTWIHRNRSNDESSFNAQEQFYQKIKQASGNIWAPKQEFIVRRSLPDRDKI
jgi:polyphosphate kinase